MVIIPIKLILQKVNGKSYTSYLITSSMKVEQRYIDSIKSNVTFCIGQNAAENFDIIDASNPNDLWFHIHDCASCHVVANIHLFVGIDRKQLTKVVKQGALLCKQYSKHKSTKNIHVMFSKIENVTKTSKIGMVNVQGCKLVSI